MSKDKKKKLQGFDKAVLKRVLTHIKKYRILVILSFVCAMITVASTLYAPILICDGNRCDSAFTVVYEYY